MKDLGTLFLAEYHNCDPHVLNDLEKIRGLMLEAAEVSGATVLSHSFHKFSPQGISGIIVISESHIAIHTWPEYGFAAVDIFTCGTRVDSWAAYRHLKQTLDSSETTVREIPRGGSYDIESKTAIHSN